VEKERGSQKGEKRKWRCLAAFLSVSDLSSSAGSRKEEGNHSNLRRQKKERRKKKKKGSFPDRPHDHLDSVIALLSTKERKKKAAFESRGEEKQEGEKRITHECGRRGKKGRSPFATRGMKESRKRKGTSHRR